MYTSHRKDSLVSHYPSQSIIHQCVGLDAGLTCLDNGIAYGLNLCKFVGKIALGNLSSDEEEFTEVGLGDPEELGVEEGGGGGVI